MTSPTDLVRGFYAKLKEGDAGGALGLMAPDIEWLTMWRYKVEAAVQSESPRAFSNR